MCHMFPTDCTLSIIGYKYVLRNFVFLTLKVHEHHIYTLAKFLQAILLNNKDNEIFK